MTFAGGEMRADQRGEPVMDENSKLYPDKVKAQCDSAIEVLRKNNENLYTANNNISGFIENDELQSKSFDKLKQQMGDYLSVIDSMISANEADIADYQTLKATVGYEILDGAVILMAKKDAQEGREEAEDAAGADRHLSDYYYGLGLSGAELGHIYEEEANAYEEEARICTETVNELQRKIDFYDYLEASTAALFITGHMIRHITEKAVSDMRGAFKLGNYFPNTRAGWRREIKERSSYPRIVKRLLGDGITGEQIRHMAAIDYSLREVEAALDLCKTGTDKEFFDGLLAGKAEKYEKAFALSPNRISDEMHIFAAGYANHIFRYNENGEISQIFADFNDAMWKSSSFLQVSCEGTPADICYRDIYLDRMYALSDMGVQGLTAEETAGELPPGGNQPSDEELEKRISLTNFWATEIIMKDKLTMWYPDEFVFLWSEKSLHDLQKRRDRIIQETAASTVENLSLITVGILAPELAVCLGTLYLDVKEKPGSLTRLERMLEIESMTDEIEECRYKKGGNLT